MSEINDLKARLQGDPTDAAAADALADLYEREREYTDLVGLLLDQLDHAKLARKQRLLERASSIFDVRLSSADNALTTLLEAFSLRPDDARFSTALARLAERADRWAELLDAYELGTAGVGDTPDALPLHRRLARWYHTHERPEDALRHWRSVVSYTPDDKGALRAVEDLLESLRDWRGLIEFLTARIEDRFETSERASLQHRVARIFEQELGAPIEALYWVANRALERDEPALHSMLDRLAEETGDWQTWAKVHEQALENTLANAEDAVPRHFRLAEVYQSQLSDARRAVGHYQWVLELDPNNIRAAHALCVLLEARSAWSELAPVLETLAVLTTDPAGRYSAWLSLGELRKTRLADVAGAVSAWFKALEARPDDRLTLSRLLDGFHDLGDWKASIKVLKKLVRLESDSSKKARYAYTLGVIQRDHLADHHKAVRALDKALDFDPTFLKAFRAIDEILTEDQDPERQDRYYRKMLQRALDAELSDEVVVGVARNLGEINRTRLNNPAAAAKAFRIALARTPSDQKLRVQTAEAARDGGDPTGALQILYDGLDLNPGAIELYHILDGIYVENGEADPAWRTAEALCVSGHANATQQQRYAARRPKLLNRKLSDGDWARMAPTQYSQPVGALLLQLHGAAAPLLAQTRRALKISRKAELDPQAPTPIGQAFARVTQITGLETPRLYHTPERMGLSVLNLSPLAIGIGAGLADASPAELLFSVARQLFLLGGQHALAIVDPDVPSRIGRLQALGAAAEQALGAGRASGMAAKIRQYGPPYLEQLQLRYDRATAHLEHPGLVNEWLAAVEDMANRLGLLLCGDLRAAARRVANEADPLGGRSAEVRLKALMAFSVSPSCIAINRVGRARG